MNIKRRDFLKQVAFISLYPLHSSNLSAITSKNFFPTLTASGSPMNLGLAHGKTFNIQIKKNLLFYIKWIISEEKNRLKELYNSARCFIPIIKETFPEQLEEMQGIAKGADLSLEEIIIINARTDLKFLFNKKQLKENPGCTSLAIESEFNNKPALAIGQNWDWNTHFKSTSVILRLTPDNGPKFVTFTEAGMLGKIGFNENKIGVCLNYLKHISNNINTGFGIPIHSLLRVVMTSKSLEDAYSKISLSKRCACANFMIAQHKESGPDIMDVEITPDAVAIIKPEKNYLLHTNHYISPSLSGGCMTKNSFSSNNRYKTGYKKLDSLNISNLDPVKSIKKVLSLREGAPHSISRSKAKDSQSTTIAGVIMDLTGNNLYIASGSPHKYPWVKLKGI